MEAPAPATVVNVTLVNTAAVAASPVAATPKKKNARKHRVLEESVKHKDALRDVKKGVVRSLKAVEAKERAEAAKQRRLINKANKLEVDTVVRIVDMKVDMPNIICDHCLCSLKPGVALRTSWKAVTVGGRALHVEQNGLPLMPSGVPVPPNPAPLLKGPDDAEADLESTRSSES